MKQLMNRDLFFAVIDAFENEIRKCEDLRRKTIGCALHCPKEERQKYLNEAELWHRWAKEAEAHQEEFYRLFEPDMG